MGYVTFKFLENSVWLYRIETKEQFQHNGVASALINFLEYFSIINNKKIIEAKYYPLNEFAKPFYQKHDYFIPNQIGTWENYDETWRMFKDLEYNKIVKNIEPKIKILESDTESVFVLEK